MVRAANKPGASEGGSAPIGRKLSFREYGMLGGAKTLMTPEKVMTVLRGTESGRVLSDLCAEIGIAPSTWWGWIDDDEALHDAFARARRIQAHAIADQAMTIADTEEDPRKAQVRIQARQWLASKRNAAVYGDKTQIAVSHTLDLSTALQEARARLSAPMTIENGPAQLPGCDDEG